MIPFSISCTVVALCSFRQTDSWFSLLQVELPGCKGIWTVYHKSSRSHAVDSSKATTEDNEYHAYLIISLETRTMVLSHGYRC